MSEAETIYINECSNPGCLISPQAHVTVEIGDYLAEVGCGEDSGPDERLLLEVLYQRRQLAQNLGISALTVLQAGLAHPEWAAALLEASGMNTLTESAEEKHERILETVSRLAVRLQPQEVPA